MPDYTTLSDFRNASNINQTEYPDAAITALITRTTYRIDEMTNRTWQQPLTKTNEKYDGDGTDILYLRQTDIQTLSAISLQESNESDSTFKTVTPSKVAVYPEGFLVIYSDAEVIRFFAGIKTSQVTYIHGATRATAINDGAGINTTVTTVTVDSTTGFPARGTIVIDSEWIDYTGTTATTFTGLTRGEHGTTAATHNDNAIINETAPAQVRDLCILMIQNFLKHEMARKQVIDTLLDKLKWKGPVMA